MGAGGVNISVGIAGEDKNYKILFGRRSGGIEYGLDRKIDTWFYWDLSLTNPGKDTNKVY
jgi:hypothetical protein